MTLFKLNKQNRLECTTNMAINFTPKENDCIEFDLLQLKKRIFEEPFLRFIFFAYKIILYLLTIFLY